MYAADARHPRKSLADKLAHLYSLRGGPTIDLTIRPDYYELLRRLNDPHLSLPPVIHVAGTNGKGSTIATLRAVLTAAGYRVHAYTSPHLVRFNERIVLAGRQIDDSTLETLLDEVTAANGDLPLTFFEITTALAFTAFARTPADVVLLETGLGGRLDCTNVVPSPLATIITAIGFDHTEFLGARLTAIAGEKAGIMKRFTPCVIGPQTDPAVMEVFTAKAADLPCPLYTYGRDWDAAPDGSGMILRDAHGTVHLPRPSLPGDHQIGNAGTALCALRLVQDRLPVPEAAMEAGLSRIDWPARLQRLQTPETEALFPASSGWELWLDGGHNESAGQILGKQAAQWRAEDGKPLHLILAMMKTKDPAAFLAPIRPHAARLIFTSLPGEELARSAADLCAAAQTGHDPADAPRPVSAQTPDLQSALALTARDAPPGRILIAGSLYLAGEAVRLLGAPPGDDL